MWKHKHTGTRARTQFQFTLLWPHNTEGTGPLKQEKAYQLNNSHSRLELTQPSGHRHRTHK